MSDANAVSAVPSGSAGEPTPPEVGILRNQLQMQRRTMTGAAFTATLDALLSAVAAAATREAEREFCLCLLPEGADTINRVTTRMLDRRALAGGAPPATQTTDTTEE